MIIKDQLQKIFPRTKSEIINRFIAPLNTTIDRYDIATPIRQSAFIAQVGHESGGFNYTKENLNYGADGLRKIFPRYFPGNLAESYARNPAKIANRVYANRMGNRDEDSGDGYKFRGRGLIQITGYDNYITLSESLELDIDSTISYLESDEGAIMSAGWFWDKRNLNPLADVENIELITRKINGGLNGLDDRKRIYLLAKKFIV
jgi:putative chitinase